MTSWARSEPEAPGEPSPDEAHWDRIYQERDERKMSWTETYPLTSLQLLEEAGLSEDARVLDAGGGTSRLVDHLVARGYWPGVLDISRSALERTRERLGVRGEKVRWIHGSVLDYCASCLWDAWHDRATFHFLLDPDDRGRYVATVRSSLAPGGAVVIATFATGGPEKCSGLPVCRYDPDTLAAALDGELAPEQFLLRKHLTPWGEEQPFLYGRFRLRERSA